MFVVRTYDYVYAGSTGDTLECALVAAGPAELWVYLADGYGKTSAVARVVKRHPELGALVQPKTNEDQTRIVSRPGEAGLPAIQSDTALAIARGVPRSFPFSRANFVVGPLPKLWLCPGEPLRPTAIKYRPSHDEVPATITVMSGVGNRTGVRINLYMPAPPRDAATMPALPDDAREILDRFGRPEKQTMALLPDADESTARRDAEPAVKALIDGYSLEAVTLPAPDLADDVQGETGAFGSFMEELRRTLPTYRYVPTGTRGLWSMKKRTAARNELVVSVDRGPMGGEASAMLTIRGPLWQQSWSLPARRGNTRLRVWNPSTLAAVCGNWSAVVDALERDVIPDLERLYWPGFAWYAAGDQ